MRHFSLKLALLVGATSIVAFAAPPPEVTVCPQAAFDTTGVIGGQSNVLYENNVGLHGTCNLAIVKNADGSFTIVSGNPVGYDGQEDQIIGVVNNSNTTITSINLSAASATPPPPFAFDGDGICAYQPFVSNSQPCNNVGSGYLGGASSFTNVNAAMTSGIVNFAPGIPPGGTSYFSLEGPVGIIVNQVQLSKSFTPATITVNGNSTLRLTVTNKSTTAVTTVAFTDNLATANLTAISPLGATVIANCGTFTVTATTVTFAGANLAAGAGCFLDLSVTSATTGALVNTTSMVTYDQAGPDAAATATLQVNQLPVNNPLPPTFGKSFMPATIAVGGTSTLTLTITNPNATQITNVSFTDPLPAGVTVTTAIGVTNPFCGGMLNVATNAVSLTGATIAGGASCTIIVGVKGTIVGPALNITSQLTLAELPNNPVPGAQAPLTVTGAIQPSISKAFGAGSIGLGNATTLTFTLTNPNLIPLTNVAFTDSLVGLGLTATAGVTNNVCGTGTLTVTATSISLAGGTLAPAVPCVFFVNVTGTAAGLKTNVTSSLTSTEAPAGDPATANINVIDLTIDAYQVNYFANLTAGDSVVDISNSGALGAGFQSGTTADIAGSICVNVFTFSPDEQLISCCSCPVTPNGLVSLSVTQDLVSNTLTPAVPTSGVIKLIATVPVGSPANCTNSASRVTGAVLAPGLLSWGTTLHATPQAGLFGVTERPFIKGTISAAELTRLGNLCGFIQTNGSRFGICKICRPGGLGAVAQ